jgi:hypothetical protein
MAAGVVGIVSRGFRLKPRTGRFPTKGFQSPLSEQDRANHRGYRRTDPSHDP